eukprot:6017490-Lingulodinium_polyedra.AAC.1
MRASGASAQVAGPRLLSVRRGRRRRGAGALDAHRPLRARGARRGRLRPLRGLRACGAPRCL